LRIEIISAVVQVKVTLACSVQCTNGAWCPRQTAAVEQRSKRPTTY